MKNWPGLARTVVASASSIEVGLLGHRAPVARHATDGSGAVLFALAEAAPECADLVTPGERGPVVDLVATDVSAVAHAGRVRGRVWLSGRADVLHQPDEQLREHLEVLEGDPVARLLPTTVGLEWFVEAGTRPGEQVTIDPQAYADAGIDALAGWADEWIAHLDVDHRDSLRDLVAHLVQPVAVVRPVHADETGLVLREHVGTCRRDIRVSFPQPVRCGCEATEALRTLVAVNAHR